MEKEERKNKFDAIYSVSIISLMEALNNANVKREDIVTIFSDSVNYIAVLYN